MSWAALQDVVSRLSDRELSAPGPQTWSVKDHLAHIAEWERACTAVLAHRPQAEGFGLDPNVYASLELDPLNDLLYERNRALSVGEVKSRGNVAHAEMVAALSTLEDGDLRRPVSEYGMTVNPARPLLEKIAGDTYAHYAEHTTWIKQLLEAI